MISPKIVDLLNQQIEKEGFSSQLYLSMAVWADKKGYKPQTEAFGDWWKDNKPNPRNIPPSVVEAEISNPGSTNIRVELNQKGDVITVIPGGKN